MYSAVFQALSDHLRAFHNAHSGINTEEFVSYFWNLFPSYQNYTLNVQNVFNNILKGNNS
jgi:hypothetical protein